MCFSSVIEWKFIKKIYMKLKHSVFIINSILSNSSCLNSLSLIIVEFFEVNFSNSCCETACLRIYLSLLFNVQSVLHRTSSESILLMSALNGKIIGFIRVCHRYNQQGMLGCSRTRNLWIDISHKTKSSVMNITEMNDEMVLFGTFHLNNEMSFLKWNWNFRQLLRNISKSKKYILFIFIYIHRKSEKNHIQGVSS